MKTILKPVDPRNSFGDPHDDAAASRTTFLMVLGALFGNGGQQVVDELKSVSDQFRVPFPEGTGQLDYRNHRERFEDRYNRSATSRFAFESGEPDYEREQLLGSLVHDLYGKPSLELAGDIVMLALHHPDPFARVAAASSFTLMFDNLAPAITEVVTLLESGIDRHARELAEIVLHRMGQRGRGPQFFYNEPMRQLTTTNDATLIIHGSHFGWVGSQIGNWWRAGGDFHTYIRDNHRPNVYSLPDAYTWSGGWSDHARQLAAGELVNWTANRSIERPDILAHSHGCNVVFRATEHGQEVDNLVLMSCPVHPDHYLPDFSRVGNIASFQINLDWVLLLDLAGSRFNRPEIQDVTLPFWFHSHGDTHSAKVWEDNAISF